MRVRREVLRIEGRVVEAGALNDSVECRPWCGWGGWCWVWRGWVGSVARGMERLGSAGGVWHGKDGWGRCKTVVEVDRREWGVEEGGMEEVGGVDGAAWNLSCTVASDLQLVPRGEHVGVAKCVFFFFYPYGGDKMKLGWLL